MLRVAVVGAGKFSAMFLSAARTLEDARIVGVADLSEERARATLARVGWRDERTEVTADALSLIDGRRVDLVVEATGSPAAAAAHALKALEERCHVVMVTAEVDALLGPLLAARAREAGVSYSLAYGDQPALVWELVEWARTCGFEVVCAGKGTKHLPAFHASTPETVWEHYGLDPAYAAREGLNAKLYNSFLDGTKSAIEMALVADATGLVPQDDGLRFPPCPADRLASVLNPGAALTRSGTVEVVSSLELDGTPVENDLRWGVYVVFATAEEHVRGWLAEYGVQTDEDGRFGALYRPSHLVGLELGVSVLRTARGEPTGTPSAFVADVVATAKRDLAAGTLLDGEGGSTVYGSLLPARRSLDVGALPVALANGVRLTRDVAAGGPVRRADVELDPNDLLVRLRAELETGFAP